MKLLTILAQKMESMLPIIMKTSDAGAVELAKQLVSSGHVIALPTDTIYGVACSANNPEAIKRLYAIKGRHEEKPVAICVSDYADIKHWAKIPKQLTDDLLKELLPGPVTIVLEKNSNLNNPFLNPGIDRIGIRIPDYDFIRNVCRELGQPLALSSANRSSEKSSLNIEEFNVIWPRLTAVFDGGSLSHKDEQRSGSTVVDLSDTTCCKVIRKGSSFEETKNVLHKFNIYLEWVD